MNFMVAFFIGAGVGASYDGNHGRAAFLYLLSAAIGVLRDSRRK